MDVLDGLSSHENVSRNLLFEMSVVLENAWHRYAIAWLGKRTGSAVFRNAGPKSLTKPQVVLFCYYSVVLLGVGRPF